MAKKPWKDVSESEKIKMKEYVDKSPPNTPLSPEFAASYLGISPATLQKMRCTVTDGIPFHKPRHKCIIYYKSDLDAHLQGNTAYRCTAQYA
ncbi:MULTISPECIES: helix-turn-helix domain-containing protein [unclassified Psychrobacter]|uniref:helix-turn-helix domain-containing protein n=1 Tax=unclassified Psychrobacter TaxID=196806 RepID=UPI0018F34165|nr:MULTISPECIES: helix-turn-helix domain-containing protein [unclassified Psychrobacter]